MKISVIGDGGWGTALATVLNRNGHEVTVWGPFADYIDEIKATGENKKFLPGVTLPDTISWTANHGEATRNAKAVVLASPSKFYPDVLAQFKSHLAPDAIVISVAKGIHRDTHALMTETAESILERKDIAALSGPSHAEEVARGTPSAVVIGCTNTEVAHQFQSLFNNPTFRVYTTDDVIGVELGGALKNIIAIAAGICDGIGYGDNAKAALITRGMAEMTRLGMALGAQPETFAGLSGMGDLIVTCLSKHSRNRGVGERLGKGESLEQIAASMAQVAEGVYNCVNAQALAREKNVEVPITDEVCQVVHDGKNPEQAVQDLLRRDPKPE